MDPPHIDSGVERRNVYLCFLEDILKILPGDGEDVIPEVTIPYLHCLDAEQV